MRRRRLGTNVSGNQIKQTWKQKRTVLDQKWWKEEARKKRVRTAGTEVGIPKALVVVYVVDQSREHEKRHHGGDLEEPDNDEEEGRELRASTRPLFLLRQARWRGIVGPADGHLEANKTRNAARDSGKQVTAA